MELATYARQKNEAGKWRYQRIEQGPGRKYGHLKPPFYFRPTLPNGKRSWIELKARSFAEAKAEIPSLEAALEAQKKGLTVAEADDLRRGCGPIAMIPHIRAGPRLTGAKLENACHRAWS